jgi:hypothetical protein
MPLRAASVPLDPASIQALRVVLDEPDLAGCVVDAVSRLAVVILNVGILPDGWQPGQLYPLHFALHRIGRVAVSYRVRDASASHAGEDVYAVRLLELDDLDRIVDGFSYRTVEDSDLIDDHAGDYFQTREPLSLDVQWEGQRAHVFGLWMDDAPRQLLDIGLWFERLYLLDAELRPVNMEALAGWRKRFRDEVRAAARARFKSPPSPSASLADVLARIETNDR